jgi:hypothetical protein
MDVLDIIINEPFSSTKTKLETLGLVVKEYPKLDLYLVKYDKNKSDMENSDVKMCRGLIAKMSNNELVCLPPSENGQRVNESTAWLTLRVGSNAQQQNLGQWPHSPLP